MDKFYYIESAQLDSFISQLSNSCQVFLPAVKDSLSQEAQYTYNNYSSQKRPFLYNPYRCLEPLKSFFTYPCEEAAVYFTAERQIAEPAQKTVIFGVKSCDIYAHKFQDFVFLEGLEVDSSFRQKRENTILVCSDCTGFKEVCHCLAWNVLPYPTEGFDLNLSPLHGGYVVEVNSSQAEALVKEYRVFFSQAKETQLSARQAKREKMVDSLKRHILPQGLIPPDKVQALMRQGYAAETWKEFMQSCVECGGCNFICDTCHCFLLKDTAAEGINKKLKLWDSCQYGNFSRVAGGANPLKSRAQRLRNRFMKKFDFFVDNLSIPACCGCGRCIEVCPGKIDIREVLRDLAKRSTAA